MAQLLDLEFGMEKWEPQQPPPPPAPGPVEGNLAAAERCEPGPHFSAAGSPVPHSPEVSPVWPGL